MNTWLFLLQTYPWSGLQHILEVIKNVDELGLIIVGDISMPIRNNGS